MPIDPNDPEIQEYVTQRLRGSGAKIKDLEGTIGTLQGQIAALQQGQADGGDALLAAERLRSVTAATVEQLTARLPETHRSMVPAKLAVEDQLEWLSQNLTLLTGSTGPTRRVTVHGGGGRSTGSTVNPGTAAAMARVAAKLRGGR